MRGTYCYMPILPARDGAFKAIEWLSAPACSRLTPLFDIPSPILRKETLEQHLGGRASSIYDSWGRHRPVYVDIHKFPLELRVYAGTHPLAYVFEALRMYGALAVPVLGTDRDAAYSLAVRQIHAKDKRGACLRLDNDDLQDVATLSDNIASIMEKTSVAPDDLDIVLELGYIGNQDGDKLSVMLLNALQTILKNNTFRNIILAGGSVPDELSKKDNGKVRRERRIEVELYTKIAQAFPGLAIAASDYGILSPYYAQPKGPVSPPSRIRYSTSTEHVFRRAQRGIGEYRKLCEQLIDPATSDFMGPGFSVGDRRIYLCAKGIINASDATASVAADTNHHLELVSLRAWEFLKEAGLLSNFALPAPEKRPLQEDLFSDVGI